MASMKKSLTAQVSLFPAFNLLICTLGTLILVLGVVTSISLGPEQRVKIDVTLPSDTHGKKPRYILWDGENVVVLPSKESFSFPSERLALELQFVAGIRKHRNSEYVVILVRPSGFESMLQLRNFFLDQNVAVGYEPVDQLWRVQTD